MYNTLKFCFKQICVFNILFELYELEIVRKKIHQKQILQITRKEQSRYLKIEL